MADYEKTYATPWRVGQHIGGENSATAIWIEADSGKRICSLHGEHALQLAERIIAAVNTDG